MRLRPFFSYYGSKFNLAPRYPYPYQDRILEPFAGSACFSLLHHHKQILLYDLDPVICSIWDYLIHVKESEIMALPNIDLDKSVDDYQLINEQKWLIGFWMNPGSSSPRRKRSTWKNRTNNSQNIWGQKIKKRISSQLEFIRHWKIKNCSYEQIPDHDGYWFIDPPYIEKGKHYKFSSKNINFSNLSLWAKSRKGTVIVCEQLGAQWMNFEFIGCNNGQKGDSTEVVYIQNQAQLSLF